jgi:beta-glucanase (GH16 family)
MIIRLIGLVLILQGLSACDSENIPDTANPSNLEVELNIADDGSGIVEIQATADNAVEYQLRIGITTEPTASNTTGAFEHTFYQPGNYQIEVRAYGLSGRYIKETRQITIVIQNNVSIDEGYTSPLSYEGYQMIWNDEFDGNALNTNNWVFETGNGCPNLCGWGNNELQYYRTQNAWVEGGLLTIEARNESYQGSSYTSARIKTQGKKSFQYGRVDVRALLPKGQGIWPALWMLGNNITSVNWPSCGEIDIVELIGGIESDNTVHGTVHWYNDGHVYAGGSHSLQTGIFANEYHVFSIIWDPTNIKWYVNDTQFYQINITPSHMTEFHKGFFFIFNIAVGGNWPGNPNATTYFPQQMRVDYIRVFQQE